jgi:hypothetical protein
MTSDLAKLMETISMLQSEPTPKPVIEIEKPTMHPLLQAMQELHEEEEQEVEQEVEEEIAYHGTTDDIAEFHPLSHFGTEKAAKDRMTYKKIKDGKIYKVDLDIKNPLTIKDFPGIHYDRLYAFELKNKKLISQEEMEAITFIQDKAELRKALLAKLKELGIDGFVYKNRYEDKGNISYVIVDPSQVKVLSVEPAAEEMTEAKNAKFLYHVTPTRNLKSIMKTGLVPNIGDRSNKITGERTGIYLFPTVEAAEDAVMNWLGDEFDEDESLTMLKVNVTGLENSISKGADYELIANTTIEPNRIHKLNTQLEEASPNTLEGSFTPDLVESKTWLAEMLAKGLKGKNAGTIYVLGSWYGNMGIFLQQAGVKFDKLVLIEPNEKWLMHSKDLLQQIGDEGKLILIHQKAEDAVYEKPGVVINTSCNETGPVFLTKLPDNMLCLLQARNNNEDTLFPTEQMEDFVDYFPLEKVYYTGEKQLEDPEINYTRFMKIGRTGKKLDEEFHTGGSLGLPFPGTYEQEYDMFKSKGPRRITTNEALDSSYPYEFKNNAYYFITDAGTDYKVEFDGTKKVEVSFVSRDISGQIKDTATGSGDSRKVFGTVINIVKDYVSQHNPEIIVFAADSTSPSRVRLYKSFAAQADKAMPGYTFVKTLKNAMYTVFYLTRDNIKVPKLDTVKNVAGRVLDKVVED